MLTNDLKTFRERGLYSLSEKLAFSTLGSFAGDDFEDLTIKNYQELLKLDILKDYPV